MAKRQPASKTSRRGRTARTRKFTAGKTPALKAGVRTAGARTAAARKTAAARPRARTPRGMAEAAPPGTPPAAGLAQVLLAVAASAGGVEVDTSHSPPLTRPKNLLGLSFNDARVGLSSGAQMERWRQNLSQLLPEVAGSRELLSLAPATRIGEAARQIAEVIARTGQDRTAPTMIVAGALAEARKRIADRWGSMLAAKSSDQLLQRLAAPAREAMGAAMLSSPGLILEFSEQPAVPIPPARATSRTQRLASLRDAFYRLASPVCAVIEKSTGTPTVQRCWLNSTVRVLGPIGAVAAVADHGDLQVVDVPRVLRREMDVAGLTVAAATARTNFGLGGRGVRVAVLDGEVHVGHPAFGTRATLQENLTSEPFGSPDGHGTAVAGIIAADHAQFGGVAPAAQILSYKVFATGSSTSGDFEGMLALEHALRDGADVANCSWGIGEPGDGTGREAKAFNTAWNEGLVIVKSAGNGGPAPGTMTSPGDADGVIVVGATEREGTAVQSYSSRGPTFNQKHPHLVAPGGTNAANIVTCLADAVGGFGGGGFGTSFAAPVVSGAVALLREQFPAATPDEIRQRLLATCRALGPDVNASGVGVLDLSLFSV